MSGRRGSRHRGRRYGGAQRSDRSRGGGRQLLTLLGQVIGSAPAPRTLAPPRLRGREGGRRGVGKEAARGWGRRPPGGGEGGCRVVGKEAAGVGGLCSRTVRYAIGHVRANGEES
jgi:hypothetical protein